jgi:type I restriction enzyme M protein
MSEAALLHCPVRGSLRVPQRAADRLTFTEEKQRIDAIRYLIQRRYPKENFGIETTLFKIGNAGRNSFRTDFAIYDRAFDDLRGKPLEKRLEHVRLLAEIKRDNSSAEQAKATQVRAALNLVPDLGTLGVYWDDVEQRFFYRHVDGKKSVMRDAPISKIPEWGDSVGTTRLSYSDLEPAKDLIRVFDEIEDSIHAQIVDKSERYTLIQQLLLFKIHDENTHRSDRRKLLPLEFQDFSVEAVADSEIVKKMNAGLSKAAAHYNLYLPKGKQIDEKFRCKAEVLRNVTKILAPVNILGSKAQVIQQFYMKFAKSLYKWDLAQYFTPHEVIDFIVEMSNPQPGEHVYDPACGSADFLISAFRRVGTDTETCVWGADNSEQAVQISILNMVMNGDGKTQIENVDSLAAYAAGNSREFSVVLCNPPFGTKILEKRYEILRKFDMGHKWLPCEKGAAITEEVRPSQQTGILFAELCVRLTKEGGRVGIILPNGYLGNRSTEYVALREWLLRHTRIVAIVAFPRFTFKKSGADVSASVVILERRKKPLKTAAESADYAFFAGNIESVGWRVGDKKSVPIYRRDDRTGVLILDDDNEPILEADFEDAIDQFARSPAANCFPWTVEDRHLRNGPQTRGIDIEGVVAGRTMILDPKRHSGKFLEVRRNIEGMPHFRMGDVAAVVPPARAKIDPTKIYKYVEIERIGIGEYDHAELRGWELPQRGKLPAQTGDIFIAHIWSSAGKWFVAGDDAKELIVTNGCTRLRLQEGKEEYLTDLALGLCSEAFAVQMRAFATGSDGLAEIVDEDILNITFPRIVDAAARALVENQVKQILSGTATFEKFARHLLKDVKRFPSPSMRKNHWALV